MRWRLLLLWTCSSGCADAPQQADAPSAPEVQDTSGDSARVAPPFVVSRTYAFCHEAEADADLAERWCDLLDEMPQGSCPGLEATCASQRFEAQGCARGGDANGGYAGVPEEGEVFRPNAWSGCSMEDADRPEFGLWEALLRWGAALGAAIGVLVFVRLLLARLGWWTRSPRDQAEMAVAHVAVVGIEGDDDLPALPEEELLDAAKQALAGGRLGEAVVYARGAALRRLARRGVLMLHRARTDREYLRGVSDLPEVSAALRDVLVAVEDHRWAGRTLASSVAERAVSAAGRILVVALLLLVALPANAARRFGPYGDAALREVLAEAGVEVVAEGGALSRLPEDVDGVLVDAYAVDLTDEDWTALLSWVDDGGFLILAGDPQDRVPGLGRRVAWIGEDQGVQWAGPWQGATKPTPAWPEGPTHHYCDGQGEPLVVPSRPIDPEVCTYPEVISAVSHGEGIVIGVADPLVLRNGGQMVPSNRRLVRDLLRVGESPGWWSMPRHPRLVLATWGSAGSGGPAGAMVSARLAPFLLQLLALWALMVLWRGWPLVPLRPDPPADRTSFSAHLDALAARLASVGARRFAASRVARLWLRRLGEDGLLQAATVRGYDADGARALVDRVVILANDPDGRDDPEDEALVEVLCRITS